MTTHRDSVPEDSSRSRTQLDDAQPADRLRLLETVLDSVNDAVVITEPTLDEPGPRILYVNPAYTRITGYPADEVIGRSPRLLRGPDTDRETAKRIRAALERGEPVREELLNYRKDGTPFWVEVNIVPVRDPQGRLTHWASVQRETTERRQMEEALARHTAILEATPDCVWIADMEGHLLYLNHAGREITGVAEPRVTGLAVTDLHPEWAASLILREGIPTAVRDGVWRGETAVRHVRDGEIPVSQVVLAHRDSRGKVSYISAIARDISDRKRLEGIHRFLAEASRTLSRSLDYDTTVQSITDLVVPEQSDYCLIDLMDEDEEIHRAAAVHRDRDRQELMGRLCRFPPGGERRLGAARVLRTGEPELVADVSHAWLRAVSRNESHLELLGELAPHSEMIIPLRVRSRVIGVITFGNAESGRTYTAEDLSLAEDFAGRAALALDNARLYDQAQQATRVRDEVLGIVAHDLRNPLNTIGMTAELLLQTGPGEEDGPRKQLQIIGRSVARADDLIQDLLDVARMEAGRLSFEREPVVPGSLVEEAVELHRTMAEQKDLRLTAEIPAELPEISADRSRIQQVLQNLVGNAIKFTPAGGEIHVRADEGDGEVRFAVADSGPGIPEADLQHLFDAFWQARKKSDEGAGLGLAIARGIVEAHEGRIWVESEVGQGTTFHFSIPVAGNQEPQPQATPRAKARDRDTEPM